MNKTNWVTEEKINELYYKQGLSALETAHKLKKGYNQIYKFMKRHQMPRRTAAETNKIKFYKSPLSFNKKIKLSVREQRLHSAAMMLYWAEGFKAGKTIDFVNSDPKMITIFVKCLRSIYQVNESRFSIQLYCYVNQHPNDLIGFWSDLIGIPKDQFTKPYIRHDFKLGKLGKMPHGVVHIRYNDLRLYQQIMQDIDKIAKDLCQDGRAVKYTAL